MSSPTHQTSVTSSKRQWKECDAYSQIRHMHLRPSLRTVPPLCRAHIPLPTSVPKIDSLRFRYFPPPHDIQSIGRLSSHYNRYNTYSHRGAGILPPNLLNIGHSLVLSRRFAEFGRSGVSEYPATERILGRKADSANAHTPYT